MLGRILFAPERFDAVLPGIFLLNQFYRPSSPDAQVPLRRESRGCRLLEDRQNGQLAVVDATRRRIIKVAWKRVQR
jgi:hypothetical protein